MSEIEWTEETWNPVTGCDKVSQGCKFCYAERFAKRLKAMGNDRYEKGFDLTLHWDKIDDPLRWRKPRIVFVNSMSDLFHKDVPFDFIERVFEVMEEASDHRFQLLTKRSKRLKDISSKLSWSENIWMGVSVESRDYTDRINDLKKVPAEVRFLSVEPLLGPIPNLPLNGIHWVIVGGESGPDSRPIEKEWVIDIRDQCLNNDVPFFFKQWGGRTSKSGGRELEGRKWDQMPNQ